MHNDGKKISASEINRYIYCPYQWYYERYYGRKYLREKYNERNRALGYTNAAKSNFIKGLKFHENYMRKDKTRRYGKMVVEIMIALAIALLVILIARAFQPEIKEVAPKLEMFGYKLFYTDQRGADKKEGILYSKQLTSEKYGLYGKPDFLFRRGNNIIPVELKSGSGESGPREGDMMQLYAYMLIAEDVFNAKVPEVIM